MRTLGSSTPPNSGKEPHNFTFRHFVMLHTSIAVQST